MQKHVVSIFRRKMEAAGCSRTLVTSTRLYGVTFQKTVTFKLYFDTATIFSQQVKKLLWNYSAAFFLSLRCLFLRRAVASWSEHKWNSSTWPSVPWQPIMWPVVSVVSDVTRPRPERRIEPAFLHWRGLWKHNIQLHICTTDLKYTNWHKLTEIYLQPARHR
jgi:hypothetical protein